MTDYITSVCVCFMYSICVYLPGSIIFLHSGFSLPCVYFMSDLWLLDFSFCICTQSYVLIFVAFVFYLLRHVSLLGVFTISRIEDEPDVKNEILIWLK